MLSSNLEKTSQETLIRLASNSKHEFVTLGTFGMLGINRRSGFFKKYFNACGVDITNA